MTPLSDPRKGFTYLFIFYISVALHTHKKLYKHITFLKTILLTLPRESRKDRRTELTSKDVLY